MGKGVGRESILISDADKVLGKSWTEDEWYKGGVLQSRVWDTTRFHKQADVMAADSFNSSSVKVGMPLNDLYTASQIILCMAELA